MADGNSSDPRTWPDRKEAAKRLGVSVGKVRKLEIQGRLVGEMVDGQWRYSDEAIDDAKEDAGREDEATLATVLASLSASLRQVFAHNERLFELVNKQQEIAVPQMAAMLTEQRTENERLRARDAEMVAQREELESKRHERDLETMKAQRREQRLDELGRELAPHLGVLARAFLARTMPGGLPPEAPPPAPPAPSGDSTPPAVPGDSPPSPLELLRRVPSLDPMALRAVCAALTAPQIRTVMEELIPKLDAVEAELNAREAAAGKSPANTNATEPPR